MGTLQHLWRNGNNPAAVQRKASGGDAAGALNYLSKLGLFRASKGIRLPSSLTELTSVVIMDTVHKPLPVGWKERAEAAIRDVRERRADMRTPEFQAELHRQAEVLRGAPEEQEALDFIEAVMGDWEATTNE
jgi:hypothetical protein